MKIKNGIVISQKFTGMVTRLCSTNTFFHAIRWLPNHYHTWIILSGHYLLSWLSAQFFWKSTRKYYKIISNIKMRTHTHTLVRVSLKKIHGSLWIKIRTQSLLNKVNIVQNYIKLIIYDEFDLKSIEKEIWIQDKQYCFVLFCFTRLTKGLWLFQRWKLIIQICIRCDPNLHEKWIRKKYSLIIRFIELKWKL